MLARRAATTVTECHQSGQDGAGGEVVALAVPEHEPNSLAGLWDLCQGSLAFPGAQGTAAPTQCPQEMPKGGRGTFVGFAVLVRDARANPTGLRVGTGTWGWAQG